MVAQNGGMKSWEKIVILHRLLTNARYPVSKDKIFREMNCSKQQFYRIRNKFQYEFDVFVNFKNHGYCISEEDLKKIQMPGIWFKTEEIEALLILEAIIENLDGGFASDLISPLRKKYQNLLQADGLKLDEMKQKIKFVPIAKRNEDSEVLKLLMTSTLYKNTIEIKHKKLGEQERTRKISPQTLLRYKDNWYLDAWCHLRKELRTFSVNRIISVTVKPGKWKKISEKQLQEHFSEGYGIFPGKATDTAKIRFKDIAAEEVSHEQWHHNQTGTFDNDGNYILTVPYGKSQELIMDILRWGNRAEVISPQSLRNEISNIIESLQKTYK